MFIEDTMEINNIKKVMIITGILIGIIILLFMVNKKDFDFGKFVTIDSRYEIVNEKGLKIPSKILLKRTTKKVLQKIIKVDYLAIIFEESDDFGNVLYVFPKDSVLGIPNGGKDAYVKVFKNIMYQKFNSSDIFMGLYNIKNEDYYFIDDDNIPFITNVKFLSNEISLDSYGELKKYGSRIIIRKKK